MSDESTTEGSTTEDSTGGSGSTQNIDHLPLEDCGYSHLPAVPVQLPDMLGTLLKLIGRYKEIQLSVNSLTNVYEIDDQTASGYQFCFGRTRSTVHEDARNELADKLRTLSDDDVMSLFDHALGDTEGETWNTEAGSLTELFLESPDQWSMSWPTLPEVCQRAQPLLPSWAASMTDPDTASAQLWPTIARYGLPYNLMMLRQVDESQTEGLASRFGDLWTSRLDALAAAGNLYLIDLSLFESTEPVEVEGFPRFTPATVTLLRQDPVTRALTPVAVRVSGYQGRDAQLYSQETATGGAWLYALQAVKTSVTVYGIWLGHVYPWHLVNAAMQMTMYNNIPSDHPIYQLLQPQSNWLIPLDNLFLLIWPHLTPPTSIHTTPSFLSLADAYAAGRDFFADDPPAKLAANGLREQDFTVEEPWDQYLLVRQQLELWEASDQLATAFVDATYADDQAVADDEALQAWMTESSDRHGGNVQGLPSMDGKQALLQVLRSLIFRGTVHGVARLNSAANPGLTFVANFPPCLQETEIPEPTAEITTEALLRFMPNAGTIGGMVNFYYVFSYSVPYTPLIPNGGVTDDLYFPGGLEDPRNQALVKFRTAVMEFARGYDPDCPQWPQWPRNVET